MSQFQNISAGIGNLLKTLSSVDPNNVLDYATSALPGYPAVTYTPASSDAIVGDVSRNERTYMFSIKVYQERKKQGEQTSEDTLRTVVDEIIDLFDSNKFLDNDRLNGFGWVKPIPSAWRYAQGEQIDLRIAEILIAVTVIE